MLNAGILAENNIDTESISPLIKRLLLDSHKNNVKMEKRKSRKGSKLHSRSKRCAKPTISQNTEDNNCHNISSKSNKWQDLIKERMHYGLPPLTKNIIPSCTDSNTVTNTGTKNRNPSDLRRSQSFEDICYSWLNKAKSNPESTQIRSGSIDCGFDGKINVTRRSNIKFSFPKVKYLTMSTFWICFKMT